MRKTALFTCLDCGNYFESNLDHGGKCTNCGSWDCVIGKDERTHAEKNPEEFPIHCTNCGAYLREVEECPNCGTEEFLETRAEVQ